MSNNRKNPGKNFGKPWKKFEKLVGEIHRSLAPMGAIVTIDDKKVPDIQTGDYRQVDCTIKYYNGTENILVAIECRKRGTKEDITWIEQMESKKKNIGANEMIGVSSTGFTSYALRKAKLCGVSLRRMDKIEPDKLLQKYTLNILELRDKTTCASFSLLSYTDEQKQYINQLLSEEVVSSGKKAVFYSGESDTPFTILQLYFPFYKKMQQQCKDVDTIEHDKKILTVNTPPKSIYFLTPTGQVYIQSFKIEFDHFSKNTVIENPIKSVYTEDEITIAETLSFEHTFLNGNAESIHCNISPKYSFGLERG